MNGNSGGFAHGKDGQMAQYQFGVRRAALTEHKYQIGQVVYFTARPVGHMAADGTYRVVKLLPSDGDDYQYRIKSASEAFERVAKESQLDRSR
jgi:hypothetical protein